MKILVAFITALVLAPIYALMGGWYLMLAVGIVHLHWLPQLPTIGYWWAVLIVFLLQGVFSSHEPTKGDSK